MSILTGPEIKRRIDAGSIVIDPFDAARLNPNSYNLRLGPTLMTYTRHGVESLDAMKLNGTIAWSIPESGQILWPGRLYLAETVEHTEAFDCVPQIQGRSSIGRLGIFVHVTAGFGDVGFRGRWTLELVVVEPVRVYAGLEIAQIIFHEAVGERQLYAGRYQGAKGVEASKLWQGKAGLNNDA